MYRCVKILPGNVRALCLTGNSYIDMQEGARIANISLKSVAAFRPGTYCVNEIAFNHARFLVNFQSS